MSKRSLSPFMRLIRLLKPDQKEIVNIYLFAILYGLVYLSLPLGVQAIINLIQGAQFTTSWLILVIVVLLGIIVSGILHLQQWRIAENLQQKLFARAAFEFGYRTPKIQLKQLYQVYTPELMNRFFDVVSLQKGLSKLLIDFPTASIQVIFGLLLLTIYHPFFILFGIITFLLAYAVYAITGERGLATSLSESKYKYSMVHWLQEVARTNLGFKFAGTTSVPLETTDEIANKYVSSREAHFKTLVQQYISSIGFKVIIVGGFLGVGSFLVIEQEMNIGQFVAAEILVLMVVNALEKITISIEVLYDVLTALEKIGYVTDLKLERNNGSTIQHLDKPFSVSFNDLNFKYPYHKEYIFKNAQLSIKSGEKIQIVGGQDAGKTTLIKLMMGAYELKDEQIFINQLPQNQISLKSLRRHSGVCQPNEFLFEGTIYENITMKRIEVSEEQINRVLELVNLADFINRMPEGVHTPVVVHGERLPQLIVEKIHLARALVHEPKMVLIENKFSSISFEELNQIILRLLKPEFKATIVMFSSNELANSGWDATYMIENCSFKKK